VINHRFSHVHADFWLGLEQRSIRRRFLVPDKSGARFAWHVPETCAGKKWSWFMCRFPERVSWV